MNRLKGIIFDMDGVILDTESIADKTWQKAAIEFGITVTEEQINKCRGSNINDTVRILKNFYGENFDSEKFLERTSVFFHQIEKESGIPLMYYAREILEYLSSKYKIALASSTREASVERQLTAVGLIDFFKIRITGDLVEHSKPDPEIYMRACKMLELEPEECAAVEDSYNGIKSAFSAGLKTIMVPDKIQPDEEIKKMCWRISSTLEELKEYL